jgi:hypothetical protein
MARAAASRSAALSLTAFAMKRALANSCTPSVAITNTSPASSRWAW